MDLDWRMMASGVSKFPAKDHGEVFDGRARRQRREKRQTADDPDHPDQQADEQPAVGGESASRAWPGLLPTGEPAIAKAGMMTRKRPISMPMPRVMLYQGVLPLSPPKADPLLAAPEV